MDYQSNSNKGKEQPSDDKPVKVVEKVVTGEVKQKSKSLGRKFREVFFGADARQVMHYVSADVLLPAFRNLLVDSFTKGIERLVWGEKDPRPLSRQDYRPRVQYSNPLSRGPIRDPRDRVMLPDQPPRVPYLASRHEVNDIVLVSRAEAELVLERLIDIIDKFQVAALADLYDLVGLPASHIDNKWGWSYLNNVTIRQVREGFVIDLPPLESI